MPATRVLKWASKAGNSRGQSGEVYVDSIPIDEALTRTIAWDCAQRPMEVDLARVDENRRGRFSDDGVSCGDPGSAGMAHRVVTL